MKTSSFLSMLRPYIRLELSLLVEKKDDDGSRSLEEMVKIMIVQKDKMMCFLERKDRDLFNSSCRS